MWAFTRLSPKLASTVGKSAGGNSATAVNISTARPCEVMLNMRVSSFTSRKLWEGPPGTCTIEPAPIPRHTVIAYGHFELAFENQKDLVPGMTMRRRTRPFRTALLTHFDR